MRFLACKPRFSLRRLFAAIATFSVSVAVIKSLSPVYVPAPHDTDALMLKVAAPTGADGREGALSDQQWDAVLRQMTSQAVLDAALADPRLSHRPGPARAHDPRAELKGLFGVSAIIASPGVNVVLLSVHSPSKPERVAGAIADAILKEGPAGVDLVGRPMSLVDARASYKWGPLDQPWKVASAWMLGTLACFLVLFLPLGYRHGRTAESGYHSMKQSQGGRLG